MIQFDDFLQEGITFSVKLRAQKEWCFDRDYHCIQSVRELENKIEKDYPGDGFLLITMDLRSSALYELKQGILHKKDPSDFYIKENR